MEYTNTAIYQVFGAEIYISISEPASLQQWVRALKGEGLIRRNARYASFRMGGRTGEKYKWVVRIDNTERWCFILCE